MSVAAVSGHFLLAIGHSSAHLDNNNKNVGFGSIRYPGRRLAAKGGISSREDLKGGLRTDAIKVIED